ncbi:MAG: hypothetical protein LBE81_10050 [Azonexus sp.]|uniref:hypothetical protein n=1 Tax=Azonexus sp. TaxID=1872668 RepID=UPI0028214779|nr:hypothetical protein [Azonexus sp.]MDR0776960.1 hypothetical protein [Azonexus sp.]
MRTRLFVYSALAIMNPTPRLFRTLIFLSFAFATASICVSFLAPGLVPEPLRIAEESILESVVESISQATGGLHLAIFYWLIAMSVVGYYGLFMFQPWARPLNVALAFTPFIVWPLLGYNLSSGWSQALGDFSGYLWAIAVSMAYFSPVSGRFLRNEG